jgi:hypothetical protein
VIVAARAVEKPRTTTLTGDGAITSSRGVSRNRDVTSEMPFGEQVSFADLQEVFPTEEALDVSWDYIFSPRGFATEWFDESSEIPKTKRDGFGVTFNGSISHPIEVWIQYDSGDELITSEKQEIQTTEKTVVFDRRSVYSEDGRFRVFVRGLRQEDVINQVDLGHVHKNLL